MAVGKPSPVVSEVSDSELAGAATAGSGSGTGRGCDMIRRLQGALRRDRLVQAAVAEAHGAGGSVAKSILVWNGDWVKNLSQDGKGLAAVRESIMWEVAFSPPECRAESVRGLVAISLLDAPGFPRLVLGRGDWRWGDVVTRNR